MSVIKLYGFAVSTHVRSARLAFHEKHLAVELQEIMGEQLQSPEYTRINPFQKMPALEHGSLRLYETPALMAYANAIGLGPSLETQDRVERARMWQFVGVAQNYLHPVGCMQLYFNSVLAPLFDMTPDEAAAEAAVAPTAIHLDVLEEALVSGYLAGNALSFADLYCGAAVDYIARARGGRALVMDRPRLNAWLAKLRGRESFQSTFPAMLLGTDHA
ncbi:hypothetical protein ASE00_08640 [Sphingomonas sp. Root710]|uniref:glutathione S-transferase family protein n=1 Tax=Sphingomonas sp. Root710 TaxID=1736594 RepID=UPI0006FE93DB|nr:glutathione S-transferase family protein [Sphingomonas sp. Root710]KRB86736.1 hypothetical protein ASE00_08640 [Sphingomonas sp. Root710]